MNKLQLITKKIRIPKETQENQNEIKKTWYKQARKQKHIFAILFSARKNWQSVYQIRIILKLWKIAAKKLGHIRLLIKTA